MSGNVHIKKNTCENRRRRVVKFEQNSLPRRIIVSKSPHSITTSISEVKSSSTVKIKNPNPSTTKPTKSDQTVQRRNKPKTSTVDGCKNCGDTSKNNVSERFSKTTSQRHAKTDDSNEKPGASGVKSNTCKMKQSVRQFYRNENFHRPSNSIEVANTVYRKKANLTTVDEASVQYLEKNSKSSSCSYYVYTDSSDSEEGVIEYHDSLDDIKEFRDKNFFECHNHTSQLNANNSATELEQHKCVYRFYLNDRLFPVPLCTDHQNNIRCVECFLPMKKNSESTIQNGAIQTKVKIDNEDEPLDMTLFLPVKESLIIRERRLDKKKPAQEEMYFGVVKLGDRDNCKNLFPTNSFALRQQKGYREYKPLDEYKFDPLAKDDVIVI